MKKAEGMSQALSLKSGLPAVLQVALQQSCPTVLLLGAPSPHLSEAVQSQGEPAEKPAQGEERRTEG